MLSGLQAHHCFLLKKGENLFSYNSVVFWVSRACRRGAGTTNTMMDILKSCISIPMHFMLPREHLHAFLSAASLLPVNVVLDGPGVQGPYCPMRSGRSMRNQRKRALGKPGPCPQSMFCSFLFACFFTALLQTLKAGFFKAKDSGAPRCS